MHRISCNLDCYVISGFWNGNWWNEDKLLLQDIIDVANDFDVNFKHWKNCSFECNEKINNLVSQKPINLSLLWKAVKKLLHDTKMLSQIQYFSDLFDNQLCILKS